MSDKASGALIFAAPRIKDTLITGLGVQESTGKRNISYASWRPCVDLEITDLVTS